jgi:hypothetical protein
MLTVPSSPDRDGSAVDGLVRHAGLLDLVGEHSGVVAERAENRPDPGAERLGRRRHPRVAGGALRARRRPAAERAVPRSAEI